MDLFFKVYRAKVRTQALPDFQDYFFVSTYKFRVGFEHIDCLFHMANSSYQSELDKARTAHLMTFARLIGLPLVKSMTERPDSSSVHAPPDGQQIPSSWGHRSIFARACRGVIIPIVGTASVTYKRELPRGATVSIETQIICWDRRRIHLLSEFQNTTDGRHVVCATVLTSVALRCGVETLNPEELINQHISPSAETLQRMQGRKEMFVEAGLDSCGLLHKLQTTCAAST